MLGLGLLSNQRLSVEAVTGVGILSMLLYPVLLWLSRQLSPLVSRTYKSWGDDRRGEWDLKITSTVHALIASGSAFYMLFIAEGPSADHVNGHALFFDVVMAGSLGYFVIDSVYPAYHCGKPVDMLFFVHHVAAIGAIGPAMFRQVISFHIACGLLSEASTPFVNAMWWLQELQLQKTVAFKVMGALVYVSFTLARIVWGAMLLRYQWVDREMVMSYGWSFSLLLLAGPAISLMNLFWYALMTKELLAVVLGKKSLQQVAEGVKKQTEAPQKKKPKAA